MNTQKKTDSSPYNYQRTFTEDKIVNQGRSPIIFVETEPIQSEKSRSPDILPMVKNIAGLRPCFKSKMLGYFGYTKKTDSNSYNYQRTFTEDKILNQGRSPIIFVETNQSSPKRGVALKSNAK